MKDIKDNVEIQMKLKSTDFINIKSVRKEILIQVKRGLSQ